MKKSVLAFWLVITALVTFAYGAIQGDFILNFQDESSTIKFYRAQGDTTNGLNVDVTRVSGDVTIIGDNTPADAYANPTDALNAISLLSLYNGSTWDRVRESAIGNGALLVGGNATPSDTYANPTASQVIWGLAGGWNGTSWDRIKSVNTGQQVTTHKTSGGIESEQPTYYQKVAEGAITGEWGVNKFGAAPDGIQTGATDIWDRADSTPTQQIWLAPTAARVHSIVSTTTADDGSPVGVGARTLRIYGLTSWAASSETSEDITLDGTTPVNTGSSYVIIHRMKVLTSGASGPNVGTITATAAAPDSTITAAILAGNGQTEMAIYGIPSTKTAYLLRWSCNIDKASVTAVTVDFRLMVNETPNTNTTVFLRKDDISVQSTGTNIYGRSYAMPYKISGPAIIKVQALGSSNDIDGESGFDLLVK